MPRPDLDARFDPTIRLTAAALGMACLLTLAGCENSNSPDQVAAPSSESAGDTHDGDDHTGHDHAGHDHPATPAGSPAGEPPATPPGTDRLYAADFSLILPEGWEERPPSNTMRLFELAAPAFGDNPAPVAAFSLAGGPVDANITRWQGQFAEPDATRNRETREIAGTTVHLVEMAGTFRGMGGPGRADTVMRAAIVERPGQPNLFIKMTGQAEAMDASSTGWETLISSLTSP